MTTTRRQVFRGELAQKPPPRAHHVACGGLVRPTLDTVHLGCTGCQHLWKWSTVERFTAEELALRFYVEEASPPTIESGLVPMLVWLWADDAHSARVVGRVHVAPAGAERFRL